MYNDPNYDKQPANAQCGLIGGKTSLKERVYHQLRQAERESARALKLAELLHLLEKNPDIAHILDLMEEVNK